MITQKYDDVTFVFKEKQNFKGCTLINGWHGIGECGFISTSHIVDNLKAERIGYIITDNMPQFLTIKNKKITFPFEIYRKENIVVILPIFEPIKNEHLKFTRSLIKWCIKEEFAQAILIGGLDKRLKDENELKVIYTQSFIHDHPNFNLSVLDEGLYVTGPLAYMLLFSELNEFPAVALLPYAERSRPDPIAASIAVKEINNLLNMKIGINELLEEAEKIEKEIQSLLKARPQSDKRDSADRGMFV